MYPNEFQRHLIAMPLYLKILLYLIVLNIINNLRSSEIWLKKHIIVLTLLYCTNFFKWIQDLQLHNILMKFDIQLFLLYLFSNGMNVDDFFQYILILTLAVWVRRLLSVANPLPQILQWKGRFFARSTWASWFRKCCCRFDSCMNARPQSGRWHLYGRSPGNINWDGKVISLHRFGSRFLSYI